MRKLNKRKIAVVILLALIIIIELLALGFSRAEKTKEINLVAVDYEQRLENYTMPINAYDGGESGYYITLPQKIGNKQVVKYIVEEKEIISQTSVEIEHIETEKEVGENGNINTPDVQKQETVSNIVEKLPEDRVFITEEELKNTRLSIKVIYDTKTDNNGKLLYNMEIVNEPKEESTESQDTTLETENPETIGQKSEELNIAIKGYLPIDAKIQLDEIPEETINVFEEHINNEQYEIKQIYNIKILSNNEKYNIEEQKYTITINGTDKLKTYKILQLNEQNELIEIEEIKKEEETISFDLNNFRTFAIIEDITLYGMNPLEIVEQSEDPVAIMFANSLRALASTADLWDGSTATFFEIGNGTQGNPYLIRNGAELAYLAERVNNGTTYEGTYFQLISDIDLNGNEWDPIGTYQNSFRGIFDGAGHIIANANIPTSSTLATTITSYGIFASIGGGNSRTEIRNVEFHNINVTITANGTFNTTSERGYNIGIVTGTMFKNSTIKNVIVKESTINDTRTVTMRNADRNQVLVGGIAGEAVNSNSSTSDPGVEARYNIDNCYVSATIELDIALYNSNRNYAAQYNVGGIIGRVRSQPVWPTNCLFEGNIKATNGFIGPIFGTVRNNTSLRTTNYATLWNGNDAGTGITMSSYYMNYTANGTRFTTDVTIGNSTARRSNSNTSMGYVQGVNKGLYTTDKSSRLENFNNNAGGIYVLWKYEDGDLSLIPRLSATAVEIEESIYKIQIDDPYNVGDYTYTWYVNGETDSSIIGDTSPKQVGTFDAGYEVRVIVYDGTYYTVVEYLVPKLYVDIEFHINKSTATATAELVGTAIPYVNMEDYTYQWYKLDIIGDEELLEGENSLTISNLENGMEYKLVATNNKEPKATVENSFIFGDRIVVFVNYNNGDDNNDGYTPETAVKTLATAYSKLKNGGTRNENVIVMMGRYTDYSYYDSQTATTYAKNVTITGRYAGINYNANWTFGGSSNYFKYLTAELSIMYITLNGNNGQMYLVCQGHSVTVGEQVKMNNYASSNTNQGLLGSRAPAFHLFAGWYQYNKTNLPNNDCEIIIKSGTYGRVILGGTPGTSDGQGQTTSHDFIGSPSNPFRVSLIVDIKNSTTATSYDYDINLLTGGSAAGNNYSVVTENIVSGKIGRALGGSIGDSKARPTGWNYPENTFLGETTINVKGGSINELYGGCLGRNMKVVGSTTATGNTCDSYFYGKININIEAGTISKNIYGAGAGGTTGYNASSSDKYKSYGSSYETEVNINISGGTILGNIYGGGYGYTEYLNQNVTATDGGTLYGDSNITITGNPTINGNIYGAGCGYNYANKPNLAGMIGNSTISISGSPTIKGQIYGAGMGVAGRTEMAKLTGTSNITVNANLTDSAKIFGGGNISKLVGTSNININAGTHNADIFGGGNIGVLEGTSYVYINDGVQGRVFGGGNEATATTTNVYVKGGNSTNIFGGGNKAAVITTNVNLQGGNVYSIYGGSNETGNVRTSNVTTTGGETVELYGGNNAGGTVSNSNVTINGGKITTAAYGGNNAGGTTTNTNVIVENGEIKNVFGGGNKAKSTETNVEIRGGNLESAFGGGNEADVGTTHLFIKGGTTQNGYGGGNKANVTTTNISLESGEIGNLFGGSNQNGNINKSNVLTKGGKATNLYGGNNLGGLVSTAEIELNGGTIENAYGGGNLVYVTTTNIIGKSGEIGNIYGGGNEAGVNTTNIDIKNGMIGNIYGGSNKSGDVQTSKITINSQDEVNLPKIDNIYGGNNQGGITQNPNIEVNSGNIGNIFGGGNQATVPKTIVTINNGNIENIYAGGNGNKALVNSDTKLLILAGNISHNVYGGGNEGIVSGSTYVDIEGGTILGNAYAGGNGKTRTKENKEEKEGAVSGSSYINIKNGTILGSAYAGGNGETAVVHKNTNITVQGNTIVGDPNEKVSAHSGSVFGGGNAAETGTEEQGYSTSTVNIVGATIYGNVYGGANTSVVNGYANLKIGYEAVADNSLEKSDIYIRGTIFGGGEANAAGAEDYDYTAISVTKGIGILIDGAGHNEFKTEGSIFGSGNASSTSGESNILIKNYGKIDNPHRNISIQRANTVTLDNVAIVLSGATDRTNKYDKEKFTFSRIDELKIKNNTTVYLNYGANLLQSLTSLTADNQIAQVNIEEDGTTTKNVDNRIYLLEGKNLNIATNEGATAFGNVNGMTFLGIYTDERTPSTSTGLYHHSFNNNEQITNLGTFSRNSYVEGRHKENHDTHADGFYTNYNNDGKIKVGYVGVTPEEGLSYIWLVGEDMDVTVFEITLTASKYATLGTAEQQLTGFSTPNTKFQIIGFSAGLEDDITLINNSDIEPVASDEAIANNIFGLTMKTGKNGWQSNNTTTFLTTNGAQYQGNSLYLSDNSQYTPSLTFCLYHSQNLSETKDIGTAIIRFQAIQPIDDLNNYISYIDVVITMNTELFPEDFYEVAISPGEEFELFTTTETSITDNSIFSMYYSLVLKEFSETKYFEDYQTYNRVLVSRDSEEKPYVLPKNTKITMLDMATNQYYYYIVTEEDETSGRYIYDLSQFIGMGSKNEPFNEKEMYNTYYIKDQNLIYENFIFHIDVSESNIKENVIDSTLFMELKNKEGETLMGVLGIQRNTAKYSIYPGKTSTIDVTATNQNTIYLGQPIDLRVTTNFLQDVIESKVILDTQYFESKMGIKITIHDINGNQLNSDTLLGVNFEYDGEKYYPRIDGSVRIKVAEKVSNVLSKITINTENNKTIATGTYTIKVESFGSPDGIYYGQEASDYTEAKVTIINGKYGLRVTTGDNSKIVDKVTGNTVNNSNSLVATVEYNSSLEKPNIVVELQRRDYSSAYAMDYRPVDFKEYFTNNLGTGHKPYEYSIINGPISKNTIFLYLKDNLKTGTYKIVFKLYDGNTYIGEAYDYLIIQ